MAALLSLSMLGMSLISVTSSIRSSHFLSPRETMRKDGSTESSIKPSEVLIYVTSYDRSSFGNCSANTWVSDALEFGYKVVYYGLNTSHHTRNGARIPSRIVEDFGASRGVRDSRDVWPLYAANILKDVLEKDPDVKFIMRMDDDSVLNPLTLWRALQALPLNRAQDWMIGDCGNDEHHSLWCGGGAGIVISRPLANKLATQLTLGVNSIAVCAVVGRNDDDAMGICADALSANIISHHGFHPWAPASVSSVGHLPWWTSWKHLGSFFGEIPALDGCPAEELGSLLVVKDWITYHHADCKVQNALSAALRARNDQGVKDEASMPLCAGALQSSRFEAQQAHFRCKDATSLSKQYLCIEKDPRLT